MAFTSIEPAKGGMRAAVSPSMPPQIRTRVPKSEGFNFLPPGTVRLYDGTTWGLYYNAAANVSYMVYDTGREWRVKPVLGKLRLSYAKGVMRQKPCCQED